MIYDEMINMAYNEICGFEKEAANGSKRQRKKNMKNAIRAWNEAPVSDKPTQRVGEALKHYDYMREQDRKSQVHQNYRDNMNQPAPVRKTSEAAPTIVTEKSAVPLNSTVNVSKNVPPVNNVANASNSINVKSINRSGSWNSRGGWNGRTRQDVGRTAPTLKVNLPAMSNNPMDAGKSKGGALASKPIDVVNTGRNLAGKPKNTGKIQGVDFEQAAKESDFRKAETERLKNFVNTGNKENASATESAASKAQDAVKKGFHPTRKQLAVAGGITGAAMLAGTAIGAYKYRKKKRAEKEQAEKTASELLDDLADIKSRHSVYEKNADELNMQVMEKEAADIKGYITKNLDKFKGTKAGRTTLSALDNAWRGAAAGALTGVAAGALSDYRQPDGNVDKKKNIARAVKNNTIMGAVGGAGWGLFKGNDAIFKGENKKSASEELDGLYKQAIGATMVTGGLAGLSSLKNIGGKFMSGYAGSSGNIMNKVVGGAKNVGLKGVNKAINKTVGGAVIGAGIDGISNAIKANGNRNPDDPNNMYNQ